MNLKDLENLAKSILPDNLDKKFDSILENLPSGVQEKVSAALKNVSPDELTKWASDLIKNIDPSALTEKLSKGEIAHLLSDTIKNADPKDVEEAIDKVEKENK